MPPRGNRLEQQLADIAHRMDVGFARSDGKQDLLLQRLDQSDRRHEKVDERLSKVERRQWPIPAVSAVAAVGATVAAVWSHLGR